MACFKILHVATTLCFIALITSLVGCASAPRSYSKVEVRGVASRDWATAERPVFLVPGESITITDPYLINALAKFFPGVGSGRVSWFGINSPHVLEFIFSDGVSAPVRVYVRLDYSLWGSNVDKGDFGVDGDLVAYLRALFSHVQVMNKEAPR